MKKIYLLLVVLMIVFLSACGNNTWVLDKDRLDEVGSVKSYAEQLQNDHTERRGFRVFTISEGKKMVVVSSGNSSQTLKFKEADITNNNITITVIEESIETEENNSYIVIGIEEIKGELSVVNESGEKYIEYE